MYHYYCFFHGTSSQLFCEDVALRHVNFKAHLFPVYLRSVSSRFGLRTMSVLSIQLALSYSFLGGGLSGQIITCKRTGTY